MKQWARHSTLVLILVIGALLPVLAFLQYHWLGELSRLEQQHRTDSLRAFAGRFSGEFDTELARLYQVFHVREAALSKAGEELAKDYAEWAESVPYADLVESVYWVEVFEDEEPRLQRLDLERGVFTESEWPDPFTDEARERFYSPDPVDPLQHDIPALVVAQHGHGPTPWAIVVLDVDVIATKFLPARADVFFGGAPIEYDMIIVDNDDPDRVVYRSESAPAPSELIGNDQTGRARFFGLHTRDFRFDWIEALPTGATEHRLRMYIRHQPGALAAAVGAIRTRNVLVSFGILLLLAGSIVLLLLTTRRAERWARLQLEYVARIAHELRTPLSVIGITSENLADRVVDDIDKARNYGKVIHKESRRLSKLIESALLHSKLESGTAEAMKRKPVAIADVIEAALDESDVSDVLVRKRVDEGLPSVMGDLEALKSALQNLFTNARKYGGSSCNLSVSARQTDGAAVEIEVEDRGPGISASDLPHIFEPFYRGGVASDEQIEGSGIGLSLVKHVVDAHGGSIRVSSPDGGGSRFTLLLPAGV